MRWFILWESHPQHSFLSFGICLQSFKPPYLLSACTWSVREKKIIMLTGLTLELWPQVSSGFSALSSHSLHFSSHCLSHSSRWCHSPQASSSLLPLSRWPCFLFLSKKHQSEEKFYSLSPLIPPPYLHFTFPPIMKTELFLFLSESKLSSCALGSSSFCSFKNFALKMIPSVSCITLPPLLHGIINTKGVTQGRKSR